MKTLRILLFVLLFLFGLACMPIGAYIYNVAPAWLLVQDGVAIFVPLLFLGFTSAIAGLFGVLQTLEDY